MAYASLLRAAAAVTDRFWNSLVVFIVVGYQPYTSTLALVTAY